MGRHLPAEHRSCGVVRHGYQTLPSPTSSVGPESAGQNIFSPIRFPHQRDCMSCLERQSSSCGFSDDLWLSTKLDPRSWNLYSSLRSSPCQASRYGISFAASFTGLYCIISTWRSCHSAPLLLLNWARSRDSSFLYNFFLLYDFPDIFVTDNYSIYLRCIYEK